jgi:hypothetical protein
MVLAKVAMWGVGTVVVAGGLAFSEGAIHVRVIEKRPDGTHLSLLVPATLVPLGMHFAPQDRLAEAGRNLKPWAPTVNAAVEGLEDCADGTLVEVTSSDQHVSVMKSGGSLVVDVDDPQETVHVSVPLRVVRQALHQLEESAPSS